MSESGWWSPRTNVIKEAVKKTGMSIADIAATVTYRSGSGRGRSMSEDTLNRILQGHRSQVRSWLPLAAALCLDPFEMREDVVSECPPGGYSWLDLHSGAKVVANQIRSGQQLNVDAILTFPGPSSIFCGQVLTALPSRRMFLTLPVYVARFVGPKVSVANNEFPAYSPIPAPDFTLLVPKALTEDKAARIVVIDDVILTGDAMTLLRKFFEEQGFPKEQIRFACCICYDYFSFPGRHRPEIRARPQYESRKSFPMPWGADSFCFEQVFAEEDTEGA